VREYVTEEVREKGCEGERVGKKSEKAKESIRLMCAGNLYLFY
jgi:hypothetical protein